MIDDKSEPGAWRKALKVPCKSRKVLDYTPSTSNGGVPRELPQPSPR